MTTPKYSCLLAAIIIASNLPGIAISRDFRSEKAFSLLPLALSEEPPPDGAWHDLRPPVAKEFASVYDSRRHRMITFGGYASSAPGRLRITNEVWSLALTGKDDWDRLVVAGDGPPPLVGASAVYDSLEDRLVVFGGWNGDGNHNEVWALSFAGAPTWEEWSPSGEIPSGRYHASAILDPLRHRMVIFGGTNSGNGLADTWSLSVQGPPAWQRIDATAASPPGRWRHGAVYDGLRRRMLVLGGTSGLYDVERSVWALSLDDPGNWTIVPVQGTPPEAGVGSAAVLDPTGDRVFVLDYWSGLLVLTFSEAGAAWSRPANAAVPPLEQRYHHGSIYDPWTRSIVFHGGYSNTEFGDTWRYTPDPADSTDSPWTRLAPSGELPPEMSAHQAAYDSTRRRMILFGAEFPHQPLQVWEFQLDGQRTWRRLTPAGGPPDMSKGMAVVLDPLRGRVLLLGGNGPNFLVNTVWAYALEGEGTWSLVATEGTVPEPRAGASAVFDVVRDRVLMFGGRTRSSNEAALWELAFSGGAHWTELAPAGPIPLARSSHTAILDEVSQRMIVFGGLAFNPLEDVFALHLDDGPRWELIPTLGTSPGPQVGHNSMLDPVRRRMMVVGLRGTWPEVRPAIWSLPLDDPQWRELSPIGAAPEAVGSSAAIYDPVVHRIVIHGGGGYLEATQTAYEWRADANRPPVAQARGPAQGVAGQELVFDGTASFDVDGDQLAHEWFFEDGSTSAGAAVTHVYWRGGVAHTVLVVRDDAANGRDTVRTEVEQQALLARLMLHGGNATLRLRSGRPTTCVRIEAIDGGFEVGDIVAGSLRMRLPDGSRSIEGSLDSAPQPRDSDRNGGDEVAACFSKDNLSMLLDGSGSVSTLPVEVAGVLVTGAEFVGRIDLQIERAEHAAETFDAAMSHVSGSLEFALGTPSELRLTIFDIRGRVIGRALDGIPFGAGDHAFDLGGWMRQGGRSPGVYVYRLDAANQKRSGKFLHLR